MARVLKAGLSAVLGGGAVYWMIHIKKNSVDDWGTGIDTVVLSNIRDHSFAANYTVWHNKLISVGDIDTSLNPLETAIAKISDVDIEIENIAGSIAPVDYLSHKVEIYMGYGATMTIATADLFFTGKLIEAKNSRNTIVFTAQGEIPRKEVGTKLDDTVHEKYKGKIIPISHGDWADAAAYLPVIVMNEYAKAPTIKFNDKTCKEFDGLFVYDKQLDRSFQTVDSSATQFTIATDINELFFYRDSGETVTKAIAEIDNKIEISDYTSIVFTEGTGSTKAAQCLLRINDEIMQVTKVPDSNTLEVERALCGTATATHAIGAPVQQYTADISDFKIKVNGRFWPKGFAVTYEKDVSGDADPIKDAGAIKDISEAASDFVNYLLNLGNLTENTTYHRYNAVLLDLIFEEMGLEGDVLNQYVLGRSITGADTKKATTFHDIYTSLGKDGEFRNIVRFTVSSVLSAPATGDRYSIGSPISYVFDVDSISLDGSGNGYIDMIQIYGGSSPSPPGTLTRVTGSGAPSISFSASDFTTHGAKKLSVIKAISLHNTTNEFNNITGSDGETDIELLDHKLLDIKDLSTSRYHVGAIAIYFDPYSTISTPVKFYNKIYGIGFRIDFKVSPIKYDFYIRGKARAHPGGYYNGSVGDLIEAPAIIIEDFCRQEAGMSDADLDQASFQAVHAERATWKLATTIFSDAKYL